MRQFRAASAEQRQTLLEVCLPLSPGMYDGDPSECGISNCTAPSGTAPAGSAILTPMRPVLLLSASRVVTLGSTGAGIVRRSGRRSAAALLAATALFAACSFDYSEAGSSPDDLLEQIPETEFTGVTHTIVRDGRVVVEIRAQQVRNFKRDGRMVLEDVFYTEYDKAGNTVTTGGAVHAVYYTEREDAEVAGAIHLRSRSQGVRLQAEVLRWENKRGRLISDARQTVAIRRDDGSQVRGAGLEVDVRRKTIRFSGSVSGTLVAGTPEGGNDQ